MTADPTLQPAARGWDLSIIVYGTPAGQGRVTFLGKGRPTVHSNRKRLLPWRSAIITAAHTAMRHQCKGPARPAWSGDPMQVDITVTVPKPKSAPKRRRTWPITRSSTDLDHHVRAINDALSEADVWKDDSQVVEVAARKVYPGEHPMSLPEPGAVIHIRVLPEAVKGVA